VVAIVAVVAVVAVVTVVAVLTLRWSSASLLPSGGGRRGGCKEASRIPGRGEEDEYRGRIAQGGVDEAQRGWEEEEGESGGCPPIAFRLGC
jgi:hypothetical protein